MKKFFQFLVIFSSSFIPALANESPVSVMEALQKIPKVELHLHLSGSYPLDYLLAIATTEQKETLQKQLETIASGLSYHDAFQIFNVIGKIVNSEEKVEEGTEALCNALEADGVVYAEIRTGLKNLGKGYEEYLKSVLSGMQKGLSEKFDARLILSLQRNSTLDQAKSTVDLALKYRNQGVVGIDVSGDTTVGDIELIIPELLRAKSQGLFLTLHLGESPKENKQGELLTRLKPDRIGHGVFLSSEALEWILEHKVPLEICLTSSVRVQMVEKFAAHPGLKFHLRGHPIIVCSDDPLIFSSSLSHELLLFSQAAVIPLDEMKKFVRQSFNYAFLPVDTKEKLLKKYERL